MAGIGKAKKTKRRSRRRGIGATGKSVYMDLALRAGGAAVSAVAVNPIVTAILKAMNKTEKDIPSIKSLVKLGLGYAAMTYGPNREIQIAGEGAIILGVMEYLQKTLPDVFKLKGEGVGSTQYIPLSNEDYMSGAEDYLGAADPEDGDFVFA